MYKEKHFLSQSFSAKTNRFSIPILKNAQDPWVIRYKDNYYYCRTHFEDNIIVAKAKELKNIGHTHFLYKWSYKSLLPKWIPIKHKQFKDIWAPELHNLDNKWYIYFSADDGNNANHRMYVLENKQATPEGIYHLKGKINSPDDNWAIDGTVLELNNQKYFIWSGWENNLNYNQNLYIASMSNPWTINSERVCISKPFYKWEKKSTIFINEGPEVLKHNNKVFIIFSATGSWTNDYCLGELELKGNNPLDPSSWHKKNKSVFRKSRKIFGPGHASFVQSPDCKEEWIIYHAARDYNSGWKRQVRAQVFHWDKKNNPNFGKPV